MVIELFEGAIYAWTSAASRATHHDLRFTLMTSRKVPMAILPNNRTPPHNELFHVLQNQKQ